MCGGATTVEFFSQERGAMACSEQWLNGPSPEALLDNIRSTFNVGSIFRTADGVGVRHLYLCGVTATPANPKVAKTALGAERAVAWSYHPNGLDVAQELKAKGYRLWALESDSRARSLLTSAGELQGSPIALVVGNEVAGVDPGILAICDRVLCIPMQGAKRSLNVAIAFSVAVYCLQIFGK